MDISEFIELIPGLPSELGLECLTRLPHSAHRVALRVCSQGATCFRAMSSSVTGRKLDTPEKSLVWFKPINNHLKMKRKNQPGQRQRVTGSPFSTRRECVGTGSTRFRSTLSGCRCSVSWRAAKEACADGCGGEGRTCRRRGRSLPPGRVMVGFMCRGHDENKNALSTAWAYDPRSDEWVGLDPMGRYRDECEGVVVGDEFWVVSGYDTERQGVFDGSAEVLDLGSGQWRRVDGVWEAGRCPRSCIGVGKNGKMVDWSGLDSGLRAGVCGVMVGSRVMVSGSEYEGAPHGFYLVEMEEGQNRKLRKMNVPDGFSGFIQSGCCVEI
ncbi:Kelch-type beta propeller [Sesbania bispinosa]|nr:Kelch-type beta propeller [Sesbania bispinosa]